MLGRKSSSTLPMNAAKVEAVTIEQLKKAADDLYRLTNQYMLGQELNVSDLEEIRRLWYNCYDIGDQFRNCHANMQTLRELQFRNNRNLLICNNSRGLTPNDFRGLSICHIFSEKSEVGAKIARKTVSEIKDSRIYLFDPNTEEIIDVTDKYREV
jgi:hypothetical protein